MTTDLTVRPTFLYALMATALLLVLSSATCVDDTDMLPGHRRPKVTNGTRGNGRGPGWNRQEHGNPLVGPGPKNPNGKDNRPNYGGGR